MKKLILVLPFLVFCNAYAAAPRSEVQLLMDIYSHYDYVCRGTPGMSPDNKVCKIRDDSARKLKQKGWCHEAPRDDSPSYTFAWQECRNPSSEKSKERELIDEFSHYDYVCRGTPGMSPDNKVCKIRDKLGDELNRKGWCHEGPTDDSPAYTYTWQKCRTPPEKK